MSTSIQYQLNNGLIGILPIKQLLNAEGKSLETRVSLLGKMQSDKVKERYLKGKCDYRIERIGGRPCVIAKKANGQPQRAILMFFGGGFILSPDEKDYDNLVDYANATNSEIWFPLYPLAPRFSMRGMIESLMAVYRTMLETWPAQQILFMGNSSGAANCLYICMYIKENRLELPYPAHLIMISPGLCIPPTAEQIDRMKKKEKTDHLIPIKFCRGIKDILMRGSPELNYLADTLSYDWTNFPSMDVFYGTAEIFSAYTPDLIQHAKDCAIDLEMHLGQDMMHCWPQVRTPEGLQARQEIKDIIKRCR